MELESYWLDTAPAFTGGVQGPVAGRADVVVVGAGFTGLSAALTLAGRLGHAKETNMNDKKFDSVNPQFFETSERIADDFKLQQ